MACCIIIFSSSCKKYLDAKTDKTLVIPSTLNDVQALLDFYSLMNGNYPSLGNESDDNYYLLNPYFNSRAENAKNRYIWSKDALNDADWTYMYQIVLNANITIETVALQPDSLKNSAKAKSILGAAYFFRAKAFYHVAQYYTVPYNQLTSETLPGIPLRLTSDVTKLTRRATIEQSWQQMISDLKKAIILLPNTNLPLSRPSKTAAYADLANIYLNMDNYKQAEKYADSALQLKNTLMDFNLLDEKQTFPFKRFNPEVIFSSVTQYPGSLSQSNYIVDSLLFQSYETNDLRRNLYYKSNGAGTVGFRGSYDGGNPPFCGIATDEIYLIKAECAARNGYKDIAMEYLNRLLVTRWVTNSFVPFNASSDDEALKIVLTERRKELILRATRWFDLRRLNKDLKFEKTLYRTQNGIQYTLPPNSSRYTFLIPAQVISITDIEQNRR